jgi:hypothetical protein
MRKLDELINETMTPEAIARAEARTDALIAEIEAARAQAVKTKKKHTKQIVPGEAIHAKARNLAERAAASSR